MTYCARVERYRTYGRARWSFYTASAGCCHLGLMTEELPVGPVLTYFVEKLADSPAVLA
jgi:hypothetical protein